MQLRPVRAGRSTLSGSSEPLSVTNPPNNERAADADARRASIDRSSAAAQVQVRRRRAVTSAAKPDADDASPAAVAKVVVGVDAKRRKRAARASNQTIDARVDLRRRARRCRSERTCAAGSAASNVTRVCVRSSQRNRQRRGRRHIAGAIAFAPVLHQSNVRMCLGDGLHRAPNSRAATGTRSRSVRAPAQRRSSQDHHIRDRRSGRRSASPSRRVRLERPSPADS